MYKKICLQRIVCKIIWIWSIYYFIFLSSSVYASAKNETKEEESNTTSLDKNENNVSKVPFIEPSWYYKLSPSTKTQIIGYGSGPSQEIAETQALADITNTLNTIVERQVQDTATVSDDGAVIEQTTVINNISHSKAVLQNASILKREKIENIIFVAMVYDTSILAVRLAQENAVQNSFKNNGILLANTHIKTKLPFYKMLISLGIERDFQLRYKNDSWYVSIGNAQILLNEKEFAENFISTVYSYSYDPQAIQVLVIDNTQLEYLENTPSRILKENQNFVLRYTPQMEEGDIYVSLFYIHSFGAVQSFVVNKLVHKGKVVIYPEVGVIKVPLPNSKISKNRKDMILAVESKKAKVVFNDFYPVNVNSRTEILQDSLLYSYGMLLDAIKNSHYASRIIWVEE